VIIGVTKRTNMQGIEQVALMLEPVGIHVSAVPVRGALHLLTVADYMGYGIVLTTREMADHPALRDFDVLVAPVDEAYAVNSLAIGDKVVMPAGYRLTADLLRGRGFEVLPVPMSAFEMADGGVTCLSLLI
jgi:dimethylargininase